MSAVYKLLLYHYKLNHRTGQYLVDIFQPVSCTRRGHGQFLLLAQLAGMSRSGAEESPSGWTAKKKEKMISISFSLFSLRN